MLGYFITAIAAVFWIFRLIIALAFSAQAGLAIQPLNMTFEIVVLVITFFCIILVAKRKMRGAVVYLITQCAYFGVDAYKKIETIIEGTADNLIYMYVFISAIAIIIPIIAIAEIGLKSGKKGSIRDKKTDWFYGTEEYQRDLDDRADKNQYKF